MKPVNKLWLLQNKVIKRLKEEIIRRRCMIFEDLRNNLYKIGIIISNAFGKTYP